MMAALSGSWESNVYVFLHFLYFTLVVRAQMTDGVAFKTLFLVNKYLQHNRAWIQALKEHYRPTFSYMRISLPLFLSVFQAFIFQQNKSKPAHCYCMCDWATGGKLRHFHWAVSMEISKFSVYHLWHNYNGWIWIYSHFVLW